MIAPKSRCRGFFRGISDEGPNSARAGKRPGRGGEVNGAHLQVQDRVQRMHQPALKRCACCSVILSLLSAHNFLAQLHQQQSPQCEPVGS